MVGDGANKQPAIVQAGPVIEEVRFAVVMYGGVALCIYMSGITDILLDMVLATARGDDPEKFLIEETLLSGPQRVLQKAAQLRTAYRRKELSEITSDVVKAEVDCKFVIDILSGTSAGGINNVFLARALACERSLDKLARLWVDEGDISTLLNDEGSRDTDSGISPGNPPQSLLNSVRMQQKLLDAFIGMAGREKTPVTRSRLVDQLDLFVTSTDLKGLDVSLSVIAGTPAKELRSRTVFHLAYDTLDVPSISTDGSFRNDFTEAFVPFLSFVSRATSCIVPAFEPIKLDDLSRLSYKNENFSKGYKPDAEKYFCFFPGYVDSKDEIADRYFGDGGYTDNFPFGPAIDAIQRRRSNVAVDRVLLYVEPDPEIRDDGANSGVNAQRPTVFEHAAAALSTKTTEKIREDVAKVRARSELLERMKYGLRAINDIGSNEKSLDPNQESLRQTVVVDYLADTLFAQAEAQKIKVERRTLFWLVQGMFLIPPPETPEEKKAREGRKEPAPENANKKDFLECFDFETIRRKITYLKRHIDEKLLKSNSIHDPETEKLLAVRRHLSECSVPIDPLTLRDDPLISFVKKLDLVSEVNDPDNPDFEDRIKSHIFGAQKRKEAYQEGLKKTSSEEFKKLKNACLDLVKTTNSEIDRCAKTLDDLRDPPDLAKKGPLMSRFEVYDKQALPMLYGIEGVESTWITLCRVSPLDSLSLESDSVKAKKKLAGAGIAHFGGFFKDMWRIHDILWGRLDAIENVIKTVIPQDTLARRQLIFQGQIAVIQEFDLEPIDGDSGKPTEPCSTIETMRATLIKKAVKSFLKELTDRKTDPTIDRSVYSVSNPEDPSPQDIITCVKAAASQVGITEWDEKSLVSFAQNKTEYKKVEMDNLDSLKLSGRGLDVLGGILATVQVPKGIQRVLVTVGRVLVAIAKILTPGSLQGSIYRHWLSLAILFDVILLLCGLVWNSAFSIGLKTTAITAVVAIVVHLFDIALKKDGGLETVKKTLISYALVLGTLGILFSGQIQKAFKELLAISSAPGSILEKCIHFFKSNIGIQWMIVAAAVIVIYVAWSRATAQSRQILGLPVPQKNTGTDVVGILTILGLVFALPTALLSSALMPQWAWLGFFLYPIAIILIVASKGIWVKQADPVVPAVASTLQDLGAGKADISDPQQLDGKN